MVLLKLFHTVVFGAALTIGLSSLLQAQPESATPEEVVQKVKAATQVLSEAGEAGLDKFRHKDSKYVWKDTYVFVIDCDEGTIAAHPINPSLEGQPLAQIPSYGSKSGEEMASEMCNIKAGSRKAGGWSTHGPSRVQISLPGRSAT